MTPWIVAHQSPLSMGFSREEYWRELPFTSPGHRPNPGIEPTSPALWWILYLLSHLGSPKEKEKLDRWYRTLFYLLIKRQCLHAYEYSLYELREGDMITLISLMDQHDF